MNDEAEPEQDEAMEWITDWDYERILPNDGVATSPVATTDRHKTNKMSVRDRKQNDLDIDGDGDILMTMEVDEDHDMHPLSLDAANGSHPGDLDDSNNREMSIFWTRVGHEDATDGDGMVGIFGMSSPRNSRNSLNLMMDDNNDQQGDAPVSNFVSSERKAKNGIERNEEGCVPDQHVGSDINVQMEEHFLADSCYSVDATPVAKDDDNDVDSIMSPLEDKEGLLPPMSPSQLYDQGNAKYGIIQSPHPHTHHLQDLNLVVKSNHAASTSADSVATNTTIDMMDDEATTIGSSQEVSSMNSSSQNSSINHSGSGKSINAPVQHLPHPYAAHPHHHYHHHHHHYYNPHYPHPPPLHPGYPSNMIERQQQLLQEVLQEAPQRNQSRRSSYELPQPTDEHQRMIEEMRSRPNNKKTKSQADPNKRRSPAPRRTNKKGQKVIDQRPNSAKSGDSNALSHRKKGSSSPKQVSKSKVDGGTGISKTQTTTESRAKTSATGGVTTKSKVKSSKLSRSASKKSPSANHATKSKVPAPHGHPYPHHHSHHHPPHHPGHHYPPHPHQHHLHHQPHVSTPTHHPHHHPHPHHRHAYHHAVTASNVGAHHHHHNPHPSQQSSSPVSVTKTLTRAGMDSDEYQKVVTRLTEKNLMERQRVLLQESMKRSLETRQALHIRPTALPDYNHDKLSKVLKDIESSSRSISETYGRR